MQINKQHKAFILTVLTTLGVSCVWTILFNTAPYSEVAEGGCWHKQRKEIRVRKKHVPQSNKGTEKWKINPFETHGGRPKWTEGGEKGVMVSRLSLPCLDSAFEVCVRDACCPLWAYVLRSDEAYGRSSGFRAIISGFTAASGLFSLCHSYFFHWFLSLSRTFLVFHFLFYLPPHHFPFSLQHQPLLRFKPMLVKGV